MSAERMAETQMQLAAIHEPYAKRCVELGLPFVDIPAVDYLWLLDRVRELEGALDGMTTMYVEFVNSGDGGIWNPEQDKEVIAARKALSAARSPSGEGQ